MLKKILREPLVHFLVAGFFLFVYFKSCSKEYGRADTIVVDRTTLLEFMQYQSKAFQEEIFAAKLEQLTQEEKEQLIQNYIRDEVLYREAVKLGLDQNDYVIKRRIIQKMEFILDDFDPSVVDVSPDSLREYYRQNRERYFQPSQFTFTHIFFKDSPEEEALGRASSFMQRKTHQQLTAEESLSYGDRFLYHRNYAEKDSRFLESQFGQTFTLALAQLEPNSKQWQGPIASEHGQHWVMLRHKEKSGIPPLSTVSELVKADYLAFLKQQRKEEQVQDLRTNYQVQINW